MYILLEQHTHQYFSFICNVRTVLDTFEDSTDSMLINYNL